MAKRARLIPAALLLAAAAIAAPGYANASDQAWQVCTRSDVKALRFITVGEATLSRHDCQTDDLQSPPLRLTFRYFRDVPGDAFAKAALNFLEKNLQATAFDQYQERFQAFNSHYQDISDGDAYTLTYREDDLTLALNNQPLASETGATFARYYLRIWFGETPYSQSLKENLLNQ
ncbi:chalcone isomerase family protein [Alcanivorax sp.]|uniref:chalcone isomerase family protein n=1 Tax=Alcanivorax sp. TaxID=1872427 RepID=UPI000C4699CF|nr:chalcone isomerase family protein [Alcanivorax sp.]MBQ25505.1 hypothetical protein [Alcanivorax sp.]|tara:strand:- start:2439 stop:2963 length:525 start_codon:yes stop_codon:yes gene_type:complete